VSLVALDSQELRLVPASFSLSSVTDSFFFGTKPGGETLSQASIPLRDCNHANRLLSVAVTCATG